MGKNVVLTCFSKRFLVENHFFGSSLRGQGSSDIQIDGYHQPSMSPGPWESLTRENPCGSSTLRTFAVHSPLAVIYLPGCSFHFKLQVCFRNVEFIMDLCPDGPCLGDAHA